MGTREELTHELQRQLCAVRQGVQQDLQIVCSKLQEVFHEELESAFYRNAPRRLSFGNRDPQYGSEQRSEHRAEQGTVSRDNSPGTGSRPQKGGLSVRTHTLTLSNSSISLEASEKLDKSTPLDAPAQLATTAPTTGIVSWMPISFPSPQTQQIAQTIQPIQPLNPDSPVMNGVVYPSQGDSLSRSFDHSELGGENAKSATAQSAAAAQANATQPNTTQAALAVVRDGEEEEEEEAPDPEDLDASGFFIRHRRGYMAGAELYPQERRLSAPGSDGLPKRCQMLGTTASMDGVMSGRISADFAIGSNDSLQSGSAPFGARVTGSMSQTNVRGCIQLIVNTPYFDFAATVLILINAAVLGIQTDLMARNLSEHEPLAFKVSERLFCVLFTAEILLKLYVNRCGFWRQDDWQWHMFDIVVVGMQLADVILETIFDSMEEAREASEEDDWRSNISIVRVLRILRLVRILRVLRTMRTISELRTIIVSIFGTLRTLLWTLLLLLLIMFMIAVTITQIVTYHLLQEADMNRREELQMYYGNLGSSILVLFQAITGGVDWRVMLTPLTEYISFWMVFPICFYIGFGIFALMNIVTGVFVESALESAQREKERFLLHTVRALFQCTDEDHSGEISWSEFQAKLDHPAMHLYFKTIDLDIEEAEDLFHLIDIDDSGSIDPEEFVNGCIRLQGPAKAIDLATLMHEFKRSQKWHARRLRRLSSAVTPISKAVVNNRIGLYPLPTQEMTLSTKRRVVV